LAYLSHDPHNYDRHCDGKNIFARCHRAPRSEIGRTLQNPTPAETKSFQIAAVHREELDLERLQFTSRPNAVRYADFRPMFLCDNAVENVRFGSKADIAAAPINVRFTPESGHSAARSRCPLCANNGH
jgi:hypothetical protein